MIDALLYAVRDAIRAAGINYGKAECEIQDDGKPPPRAGNVFVAVHDGKTRPSSGNNKRNLEELYDFSVTLTMRVTVAMDRIGDQLIARNLALVPLAQRQGFNAKVEQLRAFLHMNWPITVLTGQTPNSANDNLIAWCTGTVGGFGLPASFEGADVPALAGPDWLGAEPDSDKFAIKAEMRFSGAERLQPQTLPQGPFV